MAKGRGATRNNTNAAPSTGKSISKVGFKSPTVGKTGGKTKLGNQGTPRPGPWGQR